MMHLVIVIVGFLLTELKALDFLYHFQVKEYRLDRFTAMMGERRFIPVFFTIGKLPAKTARNILAALIITALLFALSILAYGSDTLLMGTIFGYFAVAFVAAGIGITITAIPSYLKRIALAAAATAKLKASKVTVIGITGSFGKTTTKEYLAEILSRKYQVAKTNRNMNTETGVAISILRNINRNTDYFIAEMGAYKTGEIADICRMTQPAYGILTAVGNQHLDLFGTREKLLAAKKELLASLPARGIAFINAGRAPFQTLRQGVKAATIPYTAGEKSVNLNEYRLPPEIIRENLIPCILLARELGFTEDEIKKGIQAIKEKRQRLTPQPGKKGAVIIDNSYNTNGEGFIFSIGILQKRPEGNKIMVSRGIIELGREKRPTYERIVHVLKNSGVTLYTTDEDFRIGHIKNVRLFENEKLLSQNIAVKLGKDTVILVEGKMNSDFISFLLDA